MNDLVVIMSVYINDRLEFVKKSVESILNQTFRDFNYFISFDGPVDIEIDNYISSIKDNRIRIFRLEKNGGLAEALNYMLTIILMDDAIKFIARMDADDISSPLRIETQYNFLNNHKDVSIVGSWYNEINESGNIVSSRKVPISHNQLKRRYFIMSPFPHSSVMFRRRLIEHVGLYPNDTMLMEDNALWGKSIAFGHKFANIPEYLLKYRKDDNFYSRRSGLIYGWNFIKTKFRIIKTFDFPTYTYFISFFVGLIKMMPPFVIQKFYFIARLL